MGQCRGGQWAIVAAAALATVSAYSVYDSLEVAAPPLSDAEARRPYERKYGGGGISPQVKMRVFYENEVQLFFFCGCLLL